MSLLTELNRRNVIRVGAAYLAVSWLVVQVAETVLPLYGFSTGAIRTVITVLAIGFLPALLFAWVFEITPSGLKLERDVEREQSITPVTGRKLDRLIIVVLALAVTFFLVDRFVLEPDRNQVAIDDAFRDGQSRALTEKFGDRSIAVLPFANMSGDDAQEFFSDGISEELLNLLAKIPQLRVISRSSAFSFKGQSLGIPEIARQLRVAHVLEGSVRRAGDKVRITAQLIDARTDAHVWSVTYDRTMDDIFAIQDEIAAQVVKRLEVTLLADAPRTRAADVEAYALYLKAKRLKQLGTEQSYVSAIDALQEAVTRDPHFVDAWTELSTVYSGQAGLGLRPFGEGFDLAERALRRAQEIDARDAKALCQSGEIKWRRNLDIVAAATLTLQGLSSDPTSEFCLKGLALLRGSVGRFDDAIEVWERFRDRDPLNPINVTNIGVHSWAALRFDDAIAALSEARSLSSEDVPSINTLEGLVRVLRGATGDLEAALEIVRREPIDGWRLEGLAIVNHALGNRAESDAALQELINDHARGWPYNIAAVKAFRGEADQAFEWLNLAIEYGDAGLSFIAVEPLFASLHTDARWVPFLTKIGYSPEQLARVDLDFDVSP